MNTWKKGVVSWSVGNILYISVPFTWNLQEADLLRTEWEKKKGHKVIIGGPAIGEPTECEGFDPLLFHNPCATFSSRGCGNGCSFCIVDKIEPNFIENNNYRPAPVLCDNNFTLCSRKHQEIVVEKQKVFYLTDFNQGLEASKFTPRLADLLGRIRCKIRFAFDGWYAEKAVHDAIKLCQERTTKDISVYVLIGYNDNFDDAKARLELVREWGALPNAMRYQPLDALKKDSYISPNWIGHEDDLHKMTRYYNKLNWLGHIPYEEYQYTSQVSLF